MSKSLEDFKRIIKKFNYSIPVISGNRELGKIKIGFEEIGDLKDGDEPYLTRLGIFIKHESELLIKYLNFKDKLKEKERVKDQKTNYIAYFAKLYLPFFKGWEFDFDTSTSDEYIYNLVETEGPIVLKMPAVERKVDDWLNDEEYLEPKLNNLRKALIRYWKKSNRIKKSKKKSRPPNPIIRKYGSEWLKEFKNDLRIALVEVKMTNEENKWNKPTELISKAFKNVVSSKKNELIKRKGNNLRPNEQRLCKAFLKMNALETYLDEFFKNNKEIKVLYKSFEWEPHSLAEKIITRMVGRSPRQMRNDIKSK